jgi:conjugal transfer pilin signal peptidase TrbI
MASELSAPAASQRASHRQRWLAIAVLAGLLAGSSALARWRDDHALLINTSESLPNWAFFIDRTRVPQRGDFVVFTPPLTALVRAHFGAHPAPFAKRVLGMPGDRVARMGNDVLINEKVVAQIKARTRQGEVLEPGPTGIIPPHCYFLGSNHKDGFDSRYAAIGFVCAPRIVGAGDSVL